jgi:hypothetical protein
MAFIEYRQAGRMIEQMKADREADRKRFMDSMHEVGDQAVRSSERRREGE